MNRLHVAYLVSRHPAVSQAFISREIEGLRRHGIAVQPISVRRVAPTEVRSSAEDAMARDETIALLPVSLGVLLLAHLRAAAHPPQLPPDPSSRRLTSRTRHAQATGVFGEAMLLLYHLLVWLRIRHLHTHFVGNAADIAYIARHFSKLSDGVLLTHSLTVHGPTDFFDVGRWRLVEKIEAADGVIAISDYARAQVMTHMPRPVSTPIAVSHYGVERPIPALTG